MNKNLLWHKYENTEFIKKIFTKKSATNPKPIKEDDLKNRAPTPPRDMK